MKFWPRGFQVYSAREFPYSLAFQLFVNMFQPQLAAVSSQSALATEIYSRKRKKIININRNLALQCSLISSVQKGCRLKSFVTYAEDPEEDGHSSATFQGGSHFDSAQLSHLLCISQIYEYLSAFTTTVCCSADWNSLIFAICPISHFHLGLLMRV